MIAYDSDASNLVPFDGNAAQDVFLFQDNPCEPPVIILQPVPKTVNPGDPFTLKTNATGSAPSYQWIKDGFEIPGEIGRWYDIAAAEVTDSGIYRVLVSNHCGSETSTSVLVQVGATGVEIVQSAPSAIALDSPAPSPFVERAAIRFGLPERSHVRLTIHDVAGRVVATLANGPREAGWHEIPWSGRDDGGTAVASGVYFVRLESAVGARTAKVVKLR
jgi:hypothetical protein